MSGPIYYFLIADKITKKEIGTYIDSNPDDAKYLESISNKAKDLLQTVDGGANAKNKKNKIDFENIFQIFYIITLTNTFYLAFVKNNSQFSEHENLIFELFEDIDHQGIKKLVDKNGELTKVGRQNLKFSIDKYQESSRSRKNSNEQADQSGNESSNANGSKVNSTSNETDQIRNVTSQVEEIKIEMKSGLRNLSANCMDMRELDSQSLRIKDISTKFKQDSVDLERRSRVQNAKVKLIILIALITIFGILIYFIYSKR